MDGHYDGGNKPNPLMSTPSYGPPPPTVFKLGQGPGKALASVQAVVGVSVFYAILAILIIYCFIAVWPRPTPGGIKRVESNQAQAAYANALSSNAPPPGMSSPNSNNIPPSKIGEVAGREESIYYDPQQANLFWGKFTLYNDTRLFILVLLAGALGASVHAVRSLSWYVGNRAFVTSWLLYYYLRPFVGAGLAAVFYFVIRGGFFSPTANFSETSPFGFCALAALIGLFSENAVLKLKDIADVFFVKPKSGADAVTQTTNSGQSASSSQVPPPRPTAGNPGAPNPPPPHKP